MIYNVRRGLRDHRDSNSRDNITDRYFTSMSLRDVERNHKMLEVERQLVLGREEKNLSELEPGTPGWLFTLERLEDAEQKMRQLRMRKGYYEQKTES